MKRIDERTHSCTRSKSGICNGIGSGRSGTWAQGSAHALYYNFVSSPTLSIDRSKDPIYIIVPRSKLSRISAVYYRESARPSSSSRGVYNIPYCRTSQASG